MATTTRGARVLAALGLAAVVVALAAGCGGEGVKSRREFAWGAGDPPPAPCEGMTFESSYVSDHSHLRCVTTAHLTAPPPEGATFQTSVNSGHTHKVALAQADFQEISAGGVVTARSSPALSDPHTHDFTLKK